ncbi:MAG: hypothetical protein U5O39_03700 [Gammaproteobacteria bacterium]|nr:hypothetical protein [Gammaproteobacteria bacterium]
MTDRIIAIVLSSLAASGVLASSAHGPKVERDYDPAPPAPASQSKTAAHAKSEGCMSCHTTTDSKTMHQSPGVVLGCTDCHGGDASVVFREGGDERAVLERAHVLPQYPEDWNFPDSHNPEISYTLLNRESKEFVRFVNPSDLRVANEACGACHKPIIQAAKRSLMATSAMFFGAATYANNILPFKKYLLGEAYTPEGEPSAITGPPLKNPDDAWREHGVLPVRIRCLPGSRYHRAIFFACSSAVAVTLRTCFRRPGCRTRSARSSASKNQAGPIFGNRIGVPERAVVSPCRC